MNKILILALVGWVVVGRNSTGTPAADVSAAAAVWAEVWAAVTADRTNRPIMVRTKIARWRAAYDRALASNDAAGMLDAARGLQELIFGDL